ncbi:radical SAM protein [Hyalangium rubrum]|uniref:Radical SAM/SPASM domain-containing protein n=1 Tax=Hyalangium rubrum TaxID=3103134 RepID=A0ABU5HBP5_9BACT|nr:radical SAM/SPASM domain-containing protein [Hyalangium sp. s54d21]MDY7229495.1 radical SAM/SPASM domain-containing protein [Hyalangium sp. s54d21]
MDHEASQLLRVRELRALLRRGEDPPPLHVEIHPTDVCNHRCAWCFHGGTGFDPRRKHELMQLAEYGALFQELRRLEVRNLSISGGGEPTLDPRLPELLDAAVTAGLRVRMVTHGTHLSPAVLERLAGAHEVRVSLDANAPATYAAARQVPPSFFERALSTVRALVALRDTHAPSLRVGTTFVLNEANQGEALGFARRMLGFEVDAIIFKTDIDAQRHLGSAAYARALEGVRALDDRRIEARPHAASEPRGHPCFVPFFKVAFNPYGELFSCCLGSQPGEKNGLRLGSLRGSTFANLWADSRALREQLQRGVSCTTCNATDALLNQLMRAEA